MDRIPEFDFLKAFALLLLFVYHSGLSAMYPGQLWFVQMYLLSAFFLAAGHFFYEYAKKYSIHIIAIKKASRIWIPLALFLIIVSITNMVAGASPMAYIYHATGLSIFYILQSGNLNLFHLWYLVHLLWYFAIFALLYKLVASEKLRILCVSCAFVLLSFLWATNSILKLEWKFLFFIWIFYAGMLLAEKHRLKRLMNIMDKKWLALLAIFVICILSTLSTPVIAHVNPLVSEMVNMPIFIIIRDIFCISSCIISLWLFRKIKSHSISKVARFISYGMLFSYLAQPLVSYQISLLAVSIPISIVLSFAISIFMGFSIQKLYDKALARVSLFLYPKNHIRAWKK